MKFKSFTVKLIIAAVILLVAVGLVFVYFGEILGALSKFVGIFIPFILAFLLSLVLNPIADRLHKKVKLPRTVTAVLLIVFAVVILGGIVGGVVYKIVDEVKSLYANFPQIAKSLSDWITNMRAGMENIYSSMPDYLKSTFDSTYLDIQSSFSSFINKSYQPVVSGAGNVAKKIPGVFVGTIVFLLSLFFMVSDSENVSNIIKKVIPNKIVEGMRNVCSEIKKSLGKYVKAQLIIMSVVFVIIIVGLSILNVEYALLIAIAVAVFDALPFFGSGAVLIPWSLISFIDSNMKNGVGLLIIYLSVLLTRQMIEPKIVSSKIGMNPLVTLMAMYVGYRVFSIGGMILGPVLLVLIISLKNAGAFKPAERLARFIVGYIKKEIAEFGKLIEKK